MNHLVPLLVLAAAPSFTSPDITQRLAAAEVWSRRHGVSLTSRRLEGRPNEPLPCAQLRAPAPAHCSEALKVCAGRSEGGSCSGSWTVTVWAELPGGHSLELLHRSGWDPDPFECEPPLQFWSLADGGHLELSKGQLRAEREACLREARADAKRDETEVRCDVMALNPCLGEAYLTCRGAMSGTKVHQTTWVTWSDAGVEWQHQPFELADDEDE